jgi:hypothetical protein
LCTKLRGVIMQENTIKHRVSHSVVRDPYLVIKLSLCICALFSPNRLTGERLIIVLLIIPSRVRTLRDVK